MAKIENCYILSDEEVETVRIALLVAKEDSNRYVKSGQITDQQCAAAVNRIESALFAIGK